MEDLAAPSNIESDSKDGSSCFKWHASRLELDWETASDDKKLSGQIRQTAAREIYCLTANPAPSLRSDALRRLHAHLKRLYKAVLQDDASTLPALHDEADSTATWTPSLPIHPAFPILFGVSEIPTSTGAAAAADSAEPIRMAFRHHSHSLRSGLALERHRLLRLPDVPGFAPIDAAAASDLQTRFLFYQLLKAVAHLHGDDDDDDDEGSKSYSRSKSGGGRDGGSFGGVGLAACDIRLTDHHWLVLVPAIAPALLWPPNSSTSVPHETAQDSSTPEASFLASAATPLEIHHAEMAAQLNTAASLEPKVPRPIDWGVPITEQWCQGRMSNLDYLLWLNRAVGRSTSDAKLHAVVPWVSDCVTPWGGWRDLEQSKRRLKSGDQALDLSYAHSSPPHHVAEGLSELAFYMYEARRVPLATLRATVRSNFVAAQYPVSIARLIAWSPDEATPAFYTDPSLLRSRHKGLGLADLEVPPFVVEMADEKFGGDRAIAFISYHRALLESPQVSRYLHRWIDLVFGCNLLGTAARRHRNVPLAPSRHHKGLETCTAMGSDGAYGGGGGGMGVGLGGLGAGGGQPVAGAVQKLEQRPRLVALFDTPHPPRRCAVVEPDEWHAISSSYESSCKSGSSSSNGEVYSAAAAARDLHAVGANQAQQEYRSWLKLNTASSTSTDSVGNMNHQSRERLNASTPQTPPSPPPSQTQVPTSSTSPPPPGSTPPSAAATQQSPNPLALGLESALSGDLLDNIGALFAPGLNMEGSQTDPSKSSNNSHKASNSKNSSSQSHVNQNQSKAAAVVSSASGWHVNRVQDWAIQAAMTPEVRSADQAVLDRHAHHENAAIASSHGGGNSNNGQRKTRPPGATSRQLQESKADDLLMRFLPRIQLPVPPTESSGLPDDLSKGLFEADSRRRPSGDDANRSGSTAPAAAPSKLLERSVEVATKELESRIAFAKLHDSTIDGGQKLLEHRAQVRASRLGAAAAAAAAKETSIQKASSEDTDSTFSTTPMELKHSSGQALALLRADDAFACGLLLAELATGKPALSSARVEEVYAATAAKGSQARVDLRACLEPSVNALPAPILAAIHAQLHPNPFRRPTPRALLAMVEGATLTPAPRAYAHKIQGAKEVESIKSIDHTNARFARGSDSALKRKSAFNRDCLGDSVDESSSTQSNQDRHGAALKALFPSYFPVVYDYMREVASQAQATDLADLSFHTRATSSSLRVATTANASTSTSAASTPAKGSDSASTASTTAAEATATAAVARDNMVGASSLAMLVTTLEALPTLVALPPPALAMVLPHVLHAVFGSTTPYIYAYEHLRQRRLEVQALRNSTEISDNESDDNSFDGNADETQKRQQGQNRSHNDLSSSALTSACNLGSPSSIDALLLRARRCATAPPKQALCARHSKNSKECNDMASMFVEDGDEERSSLVLHVPAVVAMVGAAVGLPAAQALFSTRVFTFLEAATQHPPALLLPLLRQAAAGSSSSSSSALEGREEGSIGGQTLSLWTAMCRTCGWATLRLHLIPQALRWLDPAHVVLDEAAAHAQVLPAVPAQRATVDSTDGDAENDEYDDDYDTTSPRELIRASTEIPAATSRMLANLVAPNGLGPMLTMRHILTPLLDMLGQNQRTITSSLPPRKVADAITSVLVAISEAEGGSRLVLPSAQLVATAVLSRAPTGAFTTLTPALKQRAAPAAAHVAFKTPPSAALPVSSPGADASVAPPLPLHVTSMTALHAATELIAVLRGLLIPQLPTNVVLQLFLGGASLKKGKRSSSKHSPGSEDARGRSAAPPTKSNSDANTSPSSTKQERKGVSGELYSIGDLLIALLPSPALVAERAAYEIAADDVGSTSATISQGAGEAERRASVQAAGVERAHVARAEKEALRDASALVAEVALHLMVSAKAAIVESVVLPMVNRFFAAFDSAYGLLLQNHATTAVNDEGKSQVAVALALARGLYLPIASLVGFEAMTTGVPAASRVRQSIHGHSSDTSSSAMAPTTSNTASPREVIHTSGSGGGRVGGRGTGRGGSHVWGDLFGGQHDSASELNLVDKGLKWFMKQKDKIGGRESRHDKTRASIGIHPNDVLGSEEQQEADEDAAWFVRETMGSRGSSSLKQPEYSSKEVEDSYHDSAHHRSTIITPAATLAAPRTPTAAAPPPATTTGAAVQATPLEVVENFFDRSATRRPRKVSSGSNDASENESLDGGYCDEDDGDEDEDEPNPFLGEDDNVEEDDEADENNEDGPKEHADSLNEPDSDDATTQPSSLSSPQLAMSTKRASKSSTYDLAASFDVMSGEGASMELGALPDRRRNSRPAGNAIASAAKGAPPLMLEANPTFSSSHGHAGGANNTARVERSRLRLAQGGKQQPRVGRAGKRLACAQPLLDFQRAGRLLPLLFAPRCQVASVVDLNPTSLRASSRALFEAMVGGGGSSGGRAQGGRISSGGSSSSSGTSGATTSGAPSSAPPGNASKGLLSSSSVHESPGSATPQRATVSSTSAASPAAPTMGTATSTAASSTVASEVGGVHGRPSNAGAGDASQDGGIRIMVTDAMETTLLTGHRGGAITVWSLHHLPELKPRCSYRAHGDGVVAAVLFGSSPCSTGHTMAPLAASCDLEGALHVWDTETATTLDAWRSGFSHGAARESRRVARASGRSPVPAPTMRWAGASNLGGGGGGCGMRYPGNNNSSSGSGGGSNIGGGLGSSHHGSGGSGGALSASSVLAARASGCAQGSAGPLDRLHAASAVGPYVALADLGAHYDLEPRPADWRAPKEARFGNDGDDDGDDDESDERWLSELEMGSNPSVWVKSPGWSTPHQLVAATPGMLHLFDLRCPRKSTNHSASSSGGGGGGGQVRVELLPRAEWALSPSPLLDLDHQDPFKGPGLRCVAAGRADVAGGLDPYLYAGSGTGRAWVVDRRNGRVLFDWQAHGSGSDGGSGGGGSSSSSNSGKAGIGGLGLGNPWDGLGGSVHDGLGSSSSGGLGGGGMAGSGGLGNAFHEARALNSAVLAVRPGAARHSCVTVSYDQSALVWDLSGATPRCVSSLKGLPSVSTAGVMGAHLHASTIQLHDFVTPSSDGGSCGSNRPGNAAPSAPPPSSRQCQQVLYAAAGHKISIAALPSPGSSETVVPRYFYDRSGHKIHRHQLTTKASVVLPLWRMVLLGGLDDKIRVCI